MYDLRTVLGNLKAALSCRRAASALEGILDGVLSDKRTVGCVKTLWRVSGIYQIPNKIL